MLLLDLGVQQQHEREGDTLLQPLRQGLVRAPFELLDRWWRALRADPD